MSEYTLKSLIDKLKRRLQDLEFDDETAKDCINDAYFDIFGDFPYRFLERIDISEEIEGGEIDLPDDYQSTNIVVVENKKTGKRKLDYLSPKDYFSAERGTIPYCYTIYSDHLLFHLPRHNEPGFDRCFGCLRPNCEDYYRIRHFYLAKPQSLVNDTDEPLVPYEFSEAIILGALARAEEVRDNFDFASIYRNEYNQKIQDLKFRYGPRNTAAEFKVNIPFGRSIG